MSYHSAQQCWVLLDSKKTGLVRRCERYASLTIPKLCLPEGFDLINTDQSHDYQSAGAQCANHLTNKIMLSLFRPSAPFFKLELSPEMRKELMDNGQTEEDLSVLLGELERQGAKELDIRAQRPKLYQVVRHLIVTGNVLLVLGKDSMRVMGIRYYCVKRDAEGRVMTLIIRERLLFDELDSKAQQAVAGRYSPDTTVDHYRLIERQENGSYKMTQHINSEQLPDEFNSQWPEDRMPYRVLTWDLADEADYGTGLVEDYIGDLEALSTLSESNVDGAVMAQEYRWLINPTGLTSVDDLNKSVNGDALAGRPEDIDVVSAGNQNAIVAGQAALEKYERRIASAFLLMSGVTRDAERVTAEEVRRVANELETAYGGVYSALGTTLQGPVAHWLLEAAKTSVRGTKLRIVVLTGLDALSRNSDLEALRLALADLAQIEMLPEGLKARINYPVVVDFVGNGRGLTLKKFLITEEQYQENLRAAQQARVQEASATMAGKAATQETLEQ